MTLLPPIDNRPSTFDNRMMFERRLRVFLALLFLGALVLAGRAAQVQVGQGDAWRDLSASNAERVAFIQPERGKIVDVRGVVLAEDVPAFEACVNYRALPVDAPDAKWLDDEANRRAKKLPAWRGADKPARAALVAQESAGVRRDLDALWDLLARVSNQDRAAIDKIRAEIAKDVEGKHDAYWQARFRKATADFGALPAQPWYERWVSGPRVAPKADAFQDDPIGEQVAFHPILADVSQAVYIELKLAQDWLPQYRPSGGATWRSVLELRPAVRRNYPRGDVACHVIGTVGPVDKDDRETDPNKDDPQRVATRSSTASAARDWKSLPSHSSAARAASATPTAAAGNCRRKNRRPARPCTRRSTSRSSSRSRTGSRASTSSARSTRRIKRFTRSTSTSR